MTSIATIQCVSPLADENPDNGNLDVFAVLDDGRKYGFVVGTPNNLYRCMENEGIDYFFGVPWVFVRKLTPENIERALRSVVEEDDEKWLNIYGALQTYME